MDWLLTFNVFIFSFAAVAIGTRPLLSFLRKRDILDHPNARSSHDIPTPRGGGLIVVPVLAIAWAWISPGPANESLIVSGLAIMIGLISWIDDLRGLSVIFRLAIQIGAVALTLTFAPFQLPVFQGLLPENLDILFTAILWLWFINLFNFMDGIDGISGVQALIIGVGIFVLPDMAALFPIAASICGVAAGFLIWNWHPAKIFLGDVGSAPLGFMLGWLLLGLAASGHWATALILPGYYLADATITLIKRLLRGERIWHAHKQHYYQMPIQKGRSHAIVAGQIAALGIILIGCVWMVTSEHFVGGLLIAALSICALLFYFAKKA